MGTITCINTSDKKKLIDALTDINISDKEKLLNEQPAAAS